MKFLLMKMETYIEIVECRRGGDYLVVKDVVNGEIVSEETVYVEVEEEEHIQITPRAYSPIGKMSYYNPHMDTTLSITVARDDSTKNKTVTITDGKYTITKIAGYLVSGWLLSLKVATDIVLVIFGNLVIDGAVTIVETKKITGTVTEYTWRGIPSDKSKGSIGYLDGLTVVYKDKNNNTKTHKEDYQPSAWKTDTFGRMMFYEVYKLDVNPTSWR